MEGEDLDYECNSYRKESSCHIYPLFQTEYIRTLLPLRR